MTRESAYLIDVSTEEGKEHSSDHFWTKIKLPEGKEKEGWDTLFPPGQGI